MLRQVDSNLAFPLSHNLCYNFIFNIFINILNKLECYRGLLQRTGQFIMRITDKEMSLNDVTILKSITVIIRSVMCRDMPKKNGRKYLSTDSRKSSITRLCRGKKINIHNSILDTCTSR